LLNHRRGPRIGCRRFAVRLRKHIASTLRSSSVAAHPARVRRRCGLRPSPPRSGSRLGGSPLPHGARCVVTCIDGRASDRELRHDPRLQQVPRPTRSPVVASGPAAALRRMHLEGSVVEVDERGFHRRRPSPCDRTGAGRVNPWRLVDSPPRLAHVGSPEAIRPPSRRSARRGEPRSTTRRFPRGGILLPSRCLVSPVHRGSTQRELPAPTTSGEREVQRFRIGTPGRSIIGETERLVKVVRRT